MKAQNTLWHGQARAINDAFEQWRQDHDKAMSVLDFEAVLHHTLEAIRELARFFESCWENLFSGKLRDLMSTGETLPEICTCLLGALECARQEAIEIRALGYSVARGDEIPEAIAGLVRARDRFRKHWPRFDQGSLARGLEQAERGEFVAEEELRHELQDQDHP